MSEFILTQDYLKEILDYDELIGTFKWKKHFFSSYIGKQAGGLNAEGYFCIKINRKTYKGHRLAWIYVNGTIEMPEIDHINGIKSDNRIINLRQCDKALNMQNKRQAQTNNQTGYLGVMKNGKRFYAEICHQKKRHYLGNFKTPELAHQAYLEAKRKLHEFCTI
jgi:hypothetical protein